MRTADIISSALIAIFGLALLFVIIPDWVPTILDGDYGLRANDMPNVAALTVTALAAAFFVRRVRGGKVAPDEGAELERAPPITRGNGWFLLQCAVFLVAVTALFNWVGFLAAGPVTIAGFMLMMGERRPLHVGVTAVGATVVIWLFFWQLLRFPLP